MSCKSWGGSNKYYTNIFYNSCRLSKNLESVGYQGIVNVVFIALIVEIQYRSYLISRGKLYECIFNVATKSLLIEKSTDCI